MRTRIILDVEPGRLEQARNVLYRALSDVKLAGDDQVHADYLKASLYRAHCVAPLDAIGVSGNMGKVSCVR